MREVMLQMWSDERGALVSVELALIATIGVIATVVGINETAVAINAELNDLSGAVGALNQTYFSTGFQSVGTQGGSSLIKSGINASAFTDGPDNCDVNQIDLIGEYGYGSSGG